MNFTILRDLELICKGEAREPQARLEPFPHGPRAFSWPDVPGAALGSGPVPSALSPSRTREGTAASPESGKRPGRPTPGSGQPPQNLRQSARRPRPPAGQGTG